MPEGGNSVEGFLNQLGLTARTDQQQASQEDAFRALGRSLGCYLQGLLEAGVTLPIALHLTESMQSSIVRSRPNASSEETPPHG
jgi:hypothetical protein